ncbi:hypothetical protein C7293_23875 [filamentous cyanobacterium CCT1]|nr:hypothetical protein C7293_23875 [filamentous cyanobacterium CCT1]PSN80769.1 hypothetical protein C8B47_04890 [filamentous cyanobacterium CCP4]
MKILVITNYYPPHYIGGYEIGCKEAVEGLKKRGHQVNVLTSNYRIKYYTKEDDEQNICRMLKFQITEKTRGLGIFFDLYLIEIFNHIVLKFTLNKFKPDIVYIWNFSGLSASLLFKVQKLGIPLFYFIFDFWLSNWKQDRWYSILDFPMTGFKGKLRELIAYPLLKNTGFYLNSSCLNLGKNIQFASHFLKSKSLEVGQSVEESTVISWGLNLSNYPYKDCIDGSSKLLYVGQVMRHKGVHTVVEALKILVNKKNYPFISLTIAGGFGDSEYESFLKGLVSSLGLDENVHFLGFVDRKELISIYHTHDILVFPSIWDEPFGITLLEGMASGIPLVSTDNGGSKEILRDGFNSLVFPKGNHYKCAEKIYQLINDANLSEKIRRNAREWVKEKFALSATLDNIESHLTNFLVDSPCKSS